MNVTGNRLSGVPVPPHPRERRVPLPWRRPKAADEDPAASRSVQAIRESPSYRLVEHDPEFLARPDVRGARLQIEYLKPDTILADQHIQHTIVVFGSTRIPEPAAARRNVEALGAALRANPENTELRLRLATANRVLAKSHYYDGARIRANGWERDAGRNRGRGDDRRRAGLDGSRQPWRVGRWSKIRSG